MGNKQSTPLKAAKIEGLSGCSSGKWLNTTLTTPADGFRDHIYPDANITALYVGSIADYTQMLTYLFLLTAYTDNFFDGNSVHAWVAWAAAPLFRALGGVGFGYVGDKYGRRVQLVASTSFLAFSAFGTMLLPRGWTIPFVLLRVVTGVGMGGELAGQDIFLLESSHETAIGHKFGGMMCAAHVATLLVAGATGGLRMLFTHDEWLRYGWRVASFVLALPIPIGLWLRIRAEETELYSKLEETKAKGGEGSLSTLSDYKKQASLGMTIAGGAVVGFVSLAYVYAEVIQKYPHSNVMFLIAIGGTLVFPIDLIMGYISDCIGLGSSLYLSQTAGVLLSIPLSVVFLTVHPSRHPALFIFSGIGVTALWEGWNRIAACAMLAELFPTEIRAQGVSLCWGPLLLLTLPLPAILEFFHTQFWLPGTIVTFFSLINLAGLHHAFGEREAGRMQLTHFRHQPYNKLQFGVKEKAMGEAEGTEGKAGKDE